MEDEFELSLALDGVLYWIKRIIPDAKDHRDLGFDPLDPAFSSLLLDAMKRAKAIHFNITYMVMLNRILTEPPGNNPAGSTNWELRTIFDTPDLRAKTTFYLSGNVISAEDIAQLP